MPVSPPPPPPPTLTFFQSPFDRARLLADGVQVPVQRGHKQQAFREGDRAGAAKPLRGHNAKIKRKKVVLSAQPAVTSPAKKKTKNTFIEKAEELDGQQV